MNDTARTWTPTHDTAGTWITTLLAGLALVVLVVAVLLSAKGPGIPREGTFLSGPAEPSEATERLDRGDTVLFGAWLGLWPTADNQAIDGFEDATDTEVEIVDIYLDWSTPAENVSHSVRYVTEEDAVPHLTWEPQTVSTPEILDGNRTLTLRDGTTPTIDAYLSTFSETICTVSHETGDPVLIRPMHEMNGRWFTWSIGYKTQDGEQPNSEDTYKQAFGKIHDAFQQACADGGEVRFIWAVNHVSLGPGTSFMGTYPGDRYVDYVGIDGYNWGGVADWGWTTFPELFDQAYCEVSTNTEKPIFISEWGSVEKGGDKAAWITEALNRVANGTYPEVQAMIWLNDLKQEREIGGAVDWRVNSSPAAAQAYADGIEHVQTTWTPRPHQGGGSPACS